jgi:hypothetical protein
MATVVTEHVPRGPEGGKTVPFSSPEATPFPTRPRDFPCLAIRHDSGNHLAPILAIDAEIAIACEQWTSRILFRHSY